jgi:hypothetical protein
MGLANRFIFQQLTLSRQRELFHTQQSATKKHRAISSSVSDDTTSEKTPNRQELGRDNEGSLGKTD